MEEKKARDTEDKPLNKDVQNDKSKGKSWKVKLCYIKDNITVEPLLAGLIIPSIISRFAMINFNLDKACRVNHNYSDEICTALVKRTGNNYTFYEKEVQKLISSIDIWKSIIHTALPCIIIMFVGAWSDRTGKRKLCILLPIFGELLTSISNIINVYFFYEIPVHVTVFLEILFPSLAGGWATMFLGVFSYISDITSEEARTFRVGLVNFCMTAGLPLGIGLSGVMLQRMGYYGVFFMTTIMFSLVLLYGCFNLPEPDEWLKRKGLPEIQRNNDKVSFFNISHVLDTVRVAYRRRPSNKRLQVMLTLITVLLLFGPSMAEHNIGYLYVRNRLNWDMVKYGLYASYSIVLHSFGAMFSITVLSRKLQVDDSMLCLISIASKFVGAVWMAFITTDIEMYIVPIIETLNATTFTSLRSIISKLVEKQETAKVNSLFSLTETISSLMFNPFYSWLYMNTLHVFAGAVYLTTAALTILASIIPLSFYIQHRKQQGSARKKAFEAEEKREADLKKTRSLSEEHVPDTVAGYEKENFKTQI